MDPSNLQNVTLKSGHNPDAFSVQEIDTALDAVVQSLRTCDDTKSLPVVKLQDNSSVVEVLEHVLAALKGKPEVLSTIPKVALKKGAGKVVEEKKVLSGYGNTTRAFFTLLSWVVPFSWKDNVEVVHDTTPSGAKVCVAFPRSSMWNQKVLLLAHGHRPEGTGLVDNLEIDGFFLSELIQLGWIVGMSSYRRDGTIVRDAMEDMNQLREFILEKVKPKKPSLIILEGRSMGGCIVTHMAERFPELYHGAVAIGAALITVDHENPLKFRHSPEIPILYLTNQSELSYVQGYIDNVKKVIEKGNQTTASSITPTTTSSSSSTADSSSPSSSSPEFPHEIDVDHIILPALWEVWREGHNHVSQEERLATLKNLEEWIKHKTFITARKQNVLMDGSPKGKRPEYKRTDNSASVEVYDVSTVFGDIALCLVPAEMQQLGIRQKKFFTMTTKSGNTRDVLYDTFPFMCPKGTWVAFDHPDGYIVVFIFGWFDKRNPGQDIGVAKGDLVIVKAKEEPKKKLN